MKRYLAFHHIHYEAHGGINDLVASSNELAELMIAVYTALEPALTNKDTWAHQTAHIYDTIKSRIVWRDGAAV